MANGEDMRLWGPDVPEGVGRTVVLLEAAPVNARPGASRVRAVVARTLASWALLAASAVGFCGCASGEDMVLFASVAFVAALVLQSIDVTDRGARVYPLATVAVLAASVVAVVALPAFRVGMFGFCNQLITRFDDVFHAYVPLLPVAADGSGWPFFVLAGVLAALAVSVLVRRRMAASVTVLVFCMGTVALWLQTGAALPAFVLALVGWLVVWRASLATVPALLRSVAVSGCTAAAALALTLGLTSLYEPIPAVDDARGSLVQAVDDVRYGSDTLPEGDLSQAAGMNDGSEERLRLSFNRQPVGGEVLLQGFVGAEYRFGTWQPLDHTAYEGSWTGMFDWLSARSFAPGQQRAALDDADAAHGAEQPQTATLSVEAVAANRSYVYAPSTLRSLEGASRIAGRDGSLLAEGIVGAGSYSMTVDSVEVAGDAVVAPSWLLDATEEDDYAVAEAVYRSFAKEHYLALDDEDRHLIERLFYGDDTWNEDDPTPATVISRIRAVLATLASYSEDPTSAPANENFLSWFLEQEHKGNAAYFATAATLAFRVQGIPARYVEGYRADLSAVEGGSTTLTSNDAHAWVEIYLDGIGWSPVEVAPGFYDRTYQVEDAIEVQQGMANDNSDAQQAGALGGDVGDGDESPDAGAAALRIVEVAMLAVGVLAALAVLAAAALEARRAYRRGRVSRQCAADDQSVAVPALFDRMASLVAAAGVPFDPTRPLEATAAVATVFPDVAPEEYRRIVSLAQKSTFGCVSLRPHELRALRRFNVRLEEGLRPARGMRDAFARRYRYGV